MKITYSGIRMPYELISEISLLNFNKNIISYTMLNIINVIIKKIIIFTNVNKLTQCHEKYQGQAKLSLLHLSTLWLRSTVPPLRSCTLCP